MKTILVLLFLSFAAPAFAQPYLLPGRDSIEHLYTTLRGPIDSATNAPFQVPIAHGDGALFGRIEGKPFTVCIRNFSDKWGPREYLLCDTAWAGTVADSTGFAPDTLHVIARALTNSTRSTWPSGSFVTVGTKYDLKIVEDSLNYGLVHLNVAKMNTWAIAPPATSSSPGTPGEIAYDSSGNLYVCYATNLWIKFTGVAF